MDETILKHMRELLTVQGWDGNWNYDEYMFGMYNGMELMLSLAEGREPVFKEKPLAYLTDITQDDWNTTQAEIQEDKAGMYREED